MNTGSSPRRRAALWLACLLGVSGCVYFNTYYNAQKFFRQAEKARELQEEEQQLAGARKRKVRETARATELYDKAARTASKVLEQYRESERVDDAMFLMGRAFYWQSDYASAARTFGDLEKNFPASEFYDRARYWRGLACEGQGERAQARELYRALFSAGKGQEAHLAGQRLGEMAFAEGDYVAAIQEYRAALEAFPQAEGRAELWLRLGEALMARGDSAAYREALEAFAHAQRERPRPETAYRARLNEGRILYASGQEEQALQLYTSLLREQRFRPFEGQTRLLIGQYYQERRLLDQALEEYGQIRDDFPQTAHSAMALYHTGMLYLRDYGDQNRAREYLQEVAKEKPGSEAADSSGERLRDLGELDRLMARVRQVDSLAAAQRDTARADSMQVAVLSDTAAAVLADSAAADMAQTAPDSAQPVDSLQVLADSLQAPEMDSLAVPVADSLSAPVEASSSPAPADTALLADLFAVAELYRSKLVLPDSAAQYYRRIIERFPGAAPAPRALYSLAWVCRELQGDSEAAAPFLERLIAEHPESEQANAARQWLGLEVRRTAEEQAAEEFARIEERRLADEGALRVWVPLLDSLSGRYPGTRAAARAAYLVAWSYENIQGDSAAAEARYERLLQEHPGSEFARLVEERRRLRETGALDKLERSLKALARGMNPAERLEVIAAEPDSADSLSLARKYLGFALRAHRRGDLPEARRQYELALEQQERLPEALYRLGSIRWQEGYFEDAQEYYQRALRYEPGSLRTCYGLLAAHLAAGAQDSANFYLREVVRRDRRNPQVEALLERFPTLSGPEPEEVNRRELEELELTPQEDWSAAGQLQGLGEAPLVRDSAAPVYPREVAADSAEVILDVLVDKEGKPERVEVFRGEPPFSEAAREAARKYTFFPGMGRDEREVRVWVEMVMRFAPPAAAEVAARPEPEPPARAQEGASPQ